MASKTVQQGALTFNILSGQDLREARARYREERESSLEAARRDPFLAALWAQVGVQVTPETPEERVIRRRELARRYEARFGRPFPG